MSDTQTRKVAVVIPAKDEQDRIAGTVRACKAIPGVDLIVVVDDGSSDDTQQVARHAGAATVRHTVNRGKASAMETGANIVAMHDAEGAEPHLLLFIDADLGESAAETTPLVEAVNQGRCDMALVGGDLLPAWPATRSNVRWGGVPPSRCRGSVVLLGRPLMLPNRSLAGGR